MHEHLCVVCGEPFDCMCEDESSEQLCDECEADENDGYTNDYIPLDEDIEN